MFTRQHYKAIAEIIRFEYTAFDGTGEDDYEGKLTIRNITNNLADYFADDNPLFNRQKFLKACGL